MLVLSQGMQPQLPLVPGRIVESFSLASPVLSAHKLLVWTEIWRVAERKGTPKVQRTKKSFRNGFQPICDVN